MYIRSAKFTASSTTLAQCPTGLPAIALIGRSNVGKSSLINAFVQQRNLARTSGTPGKTQLINYFLINQQWYLVDLPGYGWAQVSKAQKAAWAKMTWAYLKQCRELLCTWVLVDSRLPPQANDVAFINQLGHAKIPLALVWTKADKCKQQQLAKNQQAMCTELLKTWEKLPLTWVTSAEKGTGIPQLRTYATGLVASLHK